jgi:hypothetical protein
VTSEIKPPRALFALFPMGYHSEKTDIAQLQHWIITVAPAFLERSDHPVIAGFKEWKREYRDDKYDLQAFERLFRMSENKTTIRIEFAAG